MTTLVLLPGMDGTGDLFAPLLRELRLPSVVVRYPPAASTYPELEAHVGGALPASPYVLVGESFSGPLAISIAASRPRHLAGLVLCCSFASNPRPRLGVVRGLLPWLPSTPPIGLADFLLAGRFSTPALRAALAGALAQVPSATLKARSRSVADVDVSASLARVDVPLLYLRATHDRLVPRASAEAVMRLAPRASLAEFTAPHFLLQTVPVEAARALERFVCECDGTHPPPGPPIR